MNILKRSTALVVVPLGLALMIPLFLLSPLVWIFTGVPTSDLLESYMDWLEEDYWSWVNA